MTTFTPDECERLVNALMDERIHGSLDSEEQAEIEQAVEALRAYAALLYSNALNKLEINPTWISKFGDIEPEGCVYCGAIAGCCSDYPNCPNGPKT